MYGGKIDSTGNVTNELRVFHIHNESWVLLTPKAKEQYAVVGHSAHIITLKTGRVVMLVIFGHCPLYGYISNVQEYDLGRCAFSSDSFLMANLKPLPFLFCLTRFHLTLTQYFILKCSECCFITNEIQSVAAAM